MKNVSKFVGMLVLSLVCVASVKAAEVSGKVVASLNARGEEIVQKGPYGEDCTWQGEEGLVCRLPNAGVKCVKGHYEDSYEGDMGLVQRWVCEKMDPEGGFAGPASNRGNENEQAP